MEIVHIKDYLKEGLGIDPSSIVLGDYDRIGEFLARKSRSPSSPLYASVGAFFRPQYERGILIASLIGTHRLSSMLEIGWGRGYSAVCAAMAMELAGLEGGTVTSIDVRFDEQHLAAMKSTFPTSWLARIRMHQGQSTQVLPTFAGQKYDLVYIDGDHTYEGVKSDWELAKALATRFVLFDDYHLPTKDASPGIKVAQLIDEIDWASEGFLEPFMIRADRRMFIDERGYTDEQIDYGQVLVERKQ